MKLVCNYYIRNYGSVLQSYATFKTLRYFDEDVAVLQYVDRPNWKAKLEIAARIRWKYLFSPKMLRQKIRKLLSGDNEYQNIVRSRGAVFDDFNSDVLRFSVAYKTQDEIIKGLAEGEIIVIGSDQLWGPEDIIRDYHTLTWVPKTSKKIAYATSFGVKELPPFLEKRATTFLDNMSSISVREDAGCKIVRNLTGRDVLQVCDPTLLLKREDWDVIATEKLLDEPYIFCFFIGNNPKHRELSTEFSRITGLKIAAILHLDQYIPSDEGYAHYSFNNASPGDFISLIKNADYILTDSFHTTIFSVIYEKKFIVFNRYGENEFGSRNSRIDSLCDKLQISSRRYKEAGSIINQIRSEIDYQNVKSNVSDWRDESLAYLKNAIGR